MPVEGQGNPAGSANQRLRKSDELALPGEDATEVLLDGGCDWLWKASPVTRAGEQHRSVSTEVGEVQLVESDGSHGREFLALQRPQLMRRRGGKIPLRKTFPNGIQAAKCGPVVVS